VLDGLYYVKSNSESKQDCCINNQQVMNRFDDCNNDRDYLRHFSLNLDIKVIKYPQRY